MGARGATTAYGATAVSRTNAPRPEGQRAWSASGRAGDPTCLRVAIVPVTGTRPPLPRGVQVCQLSSRQPIILPSTGMRVCLMPLLHFPFCAIELRQVAHLGSHPYGLTGLEVGCLVVKCHRFGWLVACEL